MLSDVALLADQESVLDCPAWMVAGFAVNEPIIGSGACEFLSVPVELPQAKTRATRGKATFGRRARID
jgi:hypothetical protein